MELLTWLKNWLKKKKVQFKLNKEWVYKMFIRKKQKEHAKDICLKSQNNCFQWQLSVEPKLLFFNDT